MVLPARLFGADAPSKQITVGFIGTGDHGINRNLDTFLQQPDARAVAVCDVFKSRREEAKQMVDAAYGNKDCAVYGDFREVLARPDVDAVMISTPDHWHALMSAMALRAGKDVICEKPTLTIAEGRFIADLVKKTGRVFQTSTEDRSLPVYHRLAEIVRNGRLGKLQRIEVTLPSGTDYPDEAEEPVPEDLDYDLWLGPAPLAPYTPNRTERMHWRHIFDYSGGLLSDWGMHQLDTAQWANDTECTGPVEVKGTGAAHPDRQFNTFLTYDLEYRYANGVVLHVKDGGTSIHFHGSDGWVGSPGWNLDLKASRPEILKEPFGPNDLRLPTCPDGEHRSFLDAVKARKDPYFPAEVGHRCATLCHLGNIAMQTGRPLRWDPEKELFVGDEDANASRLRARPMRAPWSLERS
jgi:predicted dehydrogenase